MNASFGIYFPGYGTIYEILSAPISYLEIVIGLVGAAATKIHHSRAGRAGNVRAADSARIATRCG